MAYDRLLERLNLVDEGWIIKGATALLARDIGVRGTIDIDLYREVACSCPDVSPSLTKDSGNAATQPKQDAPSWQGRER